ncbi:Gldg family protein [uncultured Polaribacter sp.]|uniref:Gldg family protein n=1 Tax=uncultured Polaribacter sp. TaxID=174711 RepID=UPI002637D5F4|nr:Gldg family protein [uncultured Polaribacter sp.]
MKKIIKIARLELSILFYSPIAWLVLIIFFTQTALTFTDLLYRFETSQQLGRPLQRLTNILFALDDGILATAQKHLYLYIPLLTMGLMSREISSGSIKLLYSSPITITEIILGKYLSMLVYNFLLVLILLSFIFVGTLSIEALDIPFVLGGIFGVYLLMCAYAAIGLFMSSLTSYQVVAAISTLALLAILNFIGSVGQTFDFFRDITYWLSIKGRTDYFVNGLISSKDIIYFVVVIFLFLMLSTIKLSHARKTTSSAKKIITYTALVLVVVAIGYITSLPTVNKYYDTTRFKDRTLTETSQNLIKRLEHPIHITNYVNLLHYSAEDAQPKKRISDLRKFEIYRRFIPNLTMDYIYYYDDIPYRRDTTKTLLEEAKQKAKTYHINFKNVLSPEQIQAKIDLKPEGNRFVRIIKYGDKTIPLRMFNDTRKYPNETDISSTLKRILQPPSEVGILSGNDERDIHKDGDNSYKIILNGLNVRGSLINSGFDVNVQEISLKDKSNIPKGLDVLIIADPKHEYAPENLEKIKNYINAGGNALITAEPGRQNIANPIIKPLGVTFNEGVLLQESKNFDLDLIQNHFTESAAEVGLDLHESAIVTTPKAMGLSYSDATDFKVIPILKTDKAFTWNKLETFDLNTETVAFDTINDKKIEATVAVALERKITDNLQKIMIVGDADFMSNAEIINRYTPRTVNTIFTVRMFKWFSDNEYSVNTKRPKSIDTKILLNRTKINYLKIILLGMVPILMATLGAVLLFRRRRN